jgi:hypothetical protein
MKLHRAITLVAMMVLGIGVLAVLLLGGLASFDSRSLIALGIVIAGAAAGGIGFSWKRYYRR